MFRAVIGSFTGVETTTVRQGTLCLTQYAALSNNSWLVAAMHACACSTCQLLCGGHPSAPYHSPQSPHGSAATSVRGYGSRNRSAHQAAAPPFTTIKTAPTSVRRARAQANSQQLPSPPPSPLESVVLRQPQPVAEPHPVPASNRTIAGSSSNNVVGGVRASSHVSPASPLDTLTDMGALTSAGLNAAQGAGWGPGDLQHATTALARMLLSPSEMEGQGQAQQQAEEAAQAMCNAANQWVCCQSPPPTPHSLSHSPTHSPWLDKAQRGVAALSALQAAASRLSGDSLTPATHPALHSALRRGWDQVRAAALSGVQRAVGEAGRALVPTPLPAARLTALAAALAQVQAWPGARAEAGAGTPAEGTSERAALRPLWQALANACVPGVAHGAAAAYVHTGSRQAPGSPVFTLHQAAAVAAAMGGAGVQHPGLCRAVCDLAAAALGGRGGGGGRSVGEGGVLTLGEVAGVVGWAGAVGVYHPTAFTALGAAAGRWLGVQAAPSLGGLAGLTQALRRRVMGDNPHPHSLSASTAPHSLTLHHPFTLRDLATLAAGMVSSGHTGAATSQLLGGVASEAASLLLSGLAQGPAEALGGKPQQGSADDIVLLLLALWRGGATTALLLDAAAAALAPAALPHGLGPPHTSPLTGVSTQAVLAVLDVYTPPPPARPRSEVLVPAALAGEAWGEEEGVVRAMVGQQAGQGEDGGGGGLEESLHKQLLGRLWPLAGGCMVGVDVGHDAGTGGAGDHGAALAALRSHPALVEVVAGELGSRPRVTPAQAALALHLLANICARGSSGEGQGQPYTAAVAGVVRSLARCVLPRVPDTTQTHPVLAATFGAQVCVLAAGALARLGHRGDKMVEALGALVAPWSDPLPPPQSEADAYTMPTTPVVSALLRHVEAEAAAGADPSSPAMPPNTPPPLTASALARLAWSAAALHAPPPTLATLCAAALRQLGVHTGLTRPDSPNPAHPWPPALTADSCAVSQADLAGLAWALVVLQAAQPVTPRRAGREQERLAPAAAQWVVGAGGLGAADVVYRAAAWRGVGEVHAPHMALLAGVHMALLTAWGAAWAARMDSGVGGNPEGMGRGGPPGGWSNTVQFVWEAAGQEALRREAVAQEKAGGGGGTDDAKSGGGGALTTCQLREEVLAAMWHDSPQGALAPSAARAGVGVGAFTGLDVDCALRVGGRVVAVMCDGADRFLEGGEGAGGAGGGKARQGSVALPRLRGAVVWHEVVMRQLGFRVVRLPYWEWPPGPRAQHGDASDQAMAARIAYLRNKVQQAAGLKL